MIGLSACSDPVTNAITIGEVLGGRNIDVSRSLPSTRPEMFTALSEYGYIARELPMCERPEETFRSLDCVQFWAREFEKPPESRERLYFFKRISRESSGETLGLLVDLGSDGRVLNVIGYTTFSWMQ